MSDLARPRVDPRLAARLVGATEGSLFGVVVRMTPARRPNVAALIEVGPGLWAGKVGAEAIEQLARDEGVAFIEYAGAAPPDHGRAR